MVRGLFKGILVFAAFITILDLTVSLSTGRQPVFVRLGYDIFLILAGGGMSIILLARNIVFLRWGDIFPDLSLFFEALFAFVVRFPENLVDFFISFLQLPFAFLASLLRFTPIPTSIYQKIAVKIADVGVSGAIDFELATVKVHIQLEIVGIYLEFIFNLFDIFNVNEFRVNQFAFGVLIWSVPAGQYLSFPFVLSLREWFIDPVLNALKFGQVLDLEAIVQRIVERF